MSFKAFVSVSNTNWPVAGRERERERERSGEGGGHAITSISFCCTVDFHLLVVILFYKNEPKQTSLKFEIG